MLRMFHQMTRVQEPAALRNDVIHQHGRLEAHGEKTIRHFPKRLPVSCHPPTHASKLQTASHA